MVVGPMPYPRTLAWGKAELQAQLAVDKAWATYAIAQQHLSWAYSLWAEQTEIEINSFVGGAGLQADKRVEAKDEVEEHLRGQAPAEETQTTGTSRESLAVGRPPRRVDNSGHGQ